MSNSDTRNKKVFFFDEATFYLHELINIIYGCEINRRVTY